MDFDKWWRQETSGGFDDPRAMDVKRLAHEVWDVAQAFEREACAKMADERMYQGLSGAGLAKDIRGRSKD